MLQAIYCRIFGQLITLGLHVINSFVMLRSTFDQKYMKDPEINTMVSMQATYLTVWNIFFIMLYAIIALWCDIFTVLKRDYQIPKSLRNIRHKIFATIVLPATGFIFTFFWPLYLYDRNLIFPEFIDKIFSQKSNMVMHFWIVPSVLWESTFLPRTRPKSHTTNISIVTLYFVLYNTTILATYYIRGLWPYPLLKYLFGSIHFLLLLTFVYCMSVFLYYIQWSWTEYFWEKEKLKIK